MADKSRTFRCVEGDGQKSMRDELNHVVIVMDKNER